MVEIVETSLVSECARGTNADMPNDNRSLSSATAPTGVVLIVEDDLSIRDALRRLFQAVGVDVRTFGSATELLQSKLPDEASCLVLDIRLPGRSGLDLQLELEKAGSQIPIIFMTGHGDISMSVRAMKAGASDFLTKPFGDQELLDAVAAALGRDQERRTAMKVNEGLQLRFGSLSPREREVMGLATDGLMNKQIAWELNISEITVKIHRARVMKKMGARSLAELVRMYDSVKTTDCDRRSMRRE
ncbi:response regulator transcription factor [Bordetella muralis]|uniref:response regulator transcription factor n=1 Tax=Bordetella muralis TaxID=1649130 RepID=UPI0039F0F96E